MSKITHNLQHYRPLFISFEGGEGVGKTSQMKMLIDALMQAGVRDVVQTREPGGSPEGLAIRKMLVEGDPERWDGLSELLLYSTDRHEHVRQLIKPALAAKKWVLTDRFVDSTSVYQPLRGVPAAAVEQVNTLAVGDCMPDLTIMFDLDVKEGLSRSGKVNVHEKRFESLGIAFHEKVRARYLDIARANPERCRIIDASGSVDDVHQRIISVVNQFLENDQKAKN